MPKGWTTIYTNADKTTEETEKCMTQFVQNAELKHKFRSNRLKAEKYSAKNAL